MIHNAYLSHIKNCALKFSVNTCKSIWRGSVDNSQPNWLVVPYLSEVKLLTCVTSQLVWTSSKAIINRTRHKLWCRLRSQNTVFWTISYPYPFPSLNRLCEPLWLLKYFLFFLTLSLGGECRILVPWNNFKLKYGNICTSDLGNRTNSRFFT